MNCAQCLALKNHEFRVHGWLTNMENYLISPFTPFLRRIPLVIGEELKTTHEYHWILYHLLLSSWITWHELHSRRNIITKTISSAHLFLRPAAPLQNYFSQFTFYTSETWRVTFNNLNLCNISGLWNSRHLSLIPTSLSHSIILTHYAFMPHDHSLYKGVIKFPQIWTISVSQFFFLL